MKIAKSKLTAQGQVSIPADVRRELGIGPGSTIEWEFRDDRMIVRRAGSHSSVDIHRVLFPEGAVTDNPAVDKNEAIRQHIRAKHARG